MRLAVVQLEVHPTSRTITFQSALRAIDAASEIDPAPDLIVLPAFADMLSTVSGHAMVHEKLQGPMIAGCGLQARIWGLFIVMGLAESGPGKPFRTSVLLDRDGDIRLIQRQTVLKGSEADVFHAGESVDACDILLGRVALLTGDDLRDQHAWDRAASQQAEIVIGTASWSPKECNEASFDQIRSEIAQQARRCQLWCVVADVTTTNRSTVHTYPGLTAIYSDQGEIVSSAPVGEACTLWIDIALPHLADTHQDSQTSNLDSEGC